MPDQKIVKKQLKVACSWTSYDRSTLYNVCSVHRGMFSTSGVFSTSGDVQYIGGIP